MHGPNERFQDHRFHIKSDRHAVRKAQDAGSFLEHELGRGHKFNGVQVADDAYLVARLRWTWDMQRPRFHQAALTRSPIPDLGTDRYGQMHRKPLAENSAWDVDIIVSYHEPHWPDPDESARDNSRVEPPLRNEAGMWLTATSYHRPQFRFPSPPDLKLPLPRLGETPQCFMGGGPGHLGAQDMYWLVQGITSKELLANTAVSRGRKFA